MFLFLLARTALAYLPTALSVASRPPFSFRQAQYAQVFPLKPVPFCTLFTGLGSTNKSAIFFLFYYLTLALYSTPYPLLHLSFYLNLPGRSGRNCLLSPPVLSGYNGSPDRTLVSLGERLMSWPDGERYSCPLQSLVVSLLLSLVSILLFSRTGGVLSHLNSLTHKFPRFPMRNLCSLVMLAVFSLVYAATDTALLSSYLSRIGRIENPSCSACGHSSQDISHLILHYHQLRTLSAARSLETPCLFTISGLGLGKFPGLWGSMAFGHALIPRKGSGDNNNNNNSINTNFHCAILA